MMDTHWHAANHTHDTASARDNRTRSALVLESDAVVLSNISKALTGIRFATDIAWQGRDAIRMLMGNAYDLVIVDRQLPDVDGLTFVAMMRDAGVTSQILMMASPAEQVFETTGASPFGIAYLSKPFSSTELATRVNTLTKSPNPEVSARSRIHVFGLQIDCEEQVVRRENARVCLSPGEFRVLEFLAKHPGFVVSREAIFKGVWGGDLKPGSNVIDVYVGRIRSKLKSLVDIDIIRTIHGMGYVIG